MSNKDDPKPPSQDPDIHGPARPVPEAPVPPRRDPEVRIPTLAAPIDEPALTAIRDVLHSVAARTIKAVAAEVPDYRALDASEQSTLSEAVELALRGFVALAASRSDPSAPMAPALQGAYTLGRGEARAGRSMDGLLAAYRVGARTAWRGLAQAATGAGLPAVGLVGFAELVFAYIDELSAASVAGHAEELASRTRQRQHHLERLAHSMVTGASPDALTAAAARAGWNPPATMAALVLPEERVAAVLARLDRRTLQPIDDIPALGAEAAVLLLPSPDAAQTVAVVRALAGHAAVMGPARPWQQVGTSFDRAIRVWYLTSPASIDRKLAGTAAGAGPTGPGGMGPGGMGPGGMGPGGMGPGVTGAGGVLQADDFLPELVVGSDAEALADLRRRALAPLDGLRPAAANRLVETLRMWLLLRGRRDAVAAALFVHPQTVRYRVGQLRTLYGDALDDPRTALELTIALTLPTP